MKLATLGKPRSVKRPVAAETVDHTVLSFGKYKSRTPSQISEEDPDYIVWLSGETNLKDFVSPLLVRECQADLQERRAEKDEDRRDDGSNY